MVAYRLAFPRSLSSVHEVFHVSILRNYTLDPIHIVDWGELIVDADGTSRRDQCVSWIAESRFCVARP